MHQSEVLELSGRKRFM